MKKKILVVDDEDDILHFLELVLREKGYDVVTASGGHEALTRAQLEKPSLVLLDIMMPQMDGLTCLERIGKRHPDLKVIMLSAVDDPALIKSAFDRGARAFVAKHIDPRDLASVIRQANERTVYQPLGLSGEHAEPRPVEESPLTESQLRVLRALACGLPNKEIARELWLSEQTVKFHLSNIYRALGVSSRAEAIRHAYQHALVANPLLERV
jgi:DNA-binding NarL/FixJ family response regulator